MKVNIKKGKGKTNDGKGQAQRREEPKIPEMKKGENFESYKLFVWKSLIFMFVKFWKVQPGTLPTFLKV